MDKRVSAIFLAFIAMTVASCGGGGNSTSSSSGGSVAPVVSSSAKYLYVANSGDATISGFSISASGDLTPVPGGNVAAMMSKPTGLAVGSAGKVYVGNAVSRDLNTLSADLRTGQLSGSTPLADVFFKALSWTNAANLGTCGTHLFAFGEGFSQRPGTATQSDGWSGLVLNLSADGSIDSRSWSGFGTGDSLPAISNGFVDASCRYVFHANTAANSVEQSTIDIATNKFTYYQGSAAGTAPVWVAADANLKFLYAANSGSNDVSVFSIDVSSGKLTPIVGSPFPAGKQPSSVIVVQSWVYVANTGDNTVSAFTWNQASGALTTVPGSPFAVGNMPVAFTTATTDQSHSPSGMLLYVANQNSNNVSAFVIGSDGALRPTAGSPFSVGNAPKGMAVLVASQ